MGWVSYVEDILERFNESSSLLGLFLEETETVDKLDPLQVRNDLLKLHTNIKASISVLEGQMIELMTDPDFELLEKLQSVENNNIRLEIDNLRLRQEVQNQTAKYQSDLQELENRRADEVSGLKSKLNAERKEFEKSLKDAKRK